MVRRKSSRRVWQILLAAVLILGLVSLNGCNSLERLTGKKDLDEEILGSWIGDKPADQVAVSGSIESGETLTIDLYFPDPSGQYLVKEQRIIPKTLSVARESVKQWLLGPTNRQQAVSAVNSGTTLLDIGIKDGRAIVDLSREFLEPAGSVSATARLYGLVNTVAQFPSVESVSLRIEGQDLTSYQGIDTTSLVFNQELVQAVSTTGTVTYELGSPSNKETQIPVDSPSRIDLFNFSSNAI